MEEVKDWLKRHPELKPQLKQILEEKRHIKTITHKNPWVQHVKRYAYEHKISYGCAISKAKETYKKK